MQPFDFARATEVSHAIVSGGRESAKFIAGGTNLVDLMKCDVERPAHIVDINAIALREIVQVDGGIRIGALARMADVAASPLVVNNVPVISQALLNSAAPQIRNAASIG